MVVKTNKGKFFIEGVDNGNEMIAVATDICDNDNFRVFNINTTAEEIIEEINQME